MEIKAADVMKLRKMTGAGMMDCKKALIEAEGDFARAQDIIREKGKLIVAKRADRTATEGVVVTKIVGQKAATIAEMAGVAVPPETKILIGEVESVDISEEFAHEKLSPVLAMYKAKTFDEAIAKAEQLVADGGYGHTSALYIDTREKEKMEKHAAAMKTCRILINTPSSQGGIGDLYNFKLVPSLTLGCGSWGGNSVSENVGVKHLINIKTVAERRENMLWIRTPEKVYFKKGCLPVALDELGTVMHKKRCFIVTDSFLYKNGYTKKIEDKLDQMGIVHHSNYIRWFEEARCDLLDYMGVGFADLEKQGIISPILSVEADYLRMVYYGDTVSIDAYIKEYNGIKLIVGYEVKDDRTGMVHCRGTSKHCFIDKTGRPLVLRKSFPELNEAFEAGVKVHKENKKALIKKREDK